MRWKGGRSAEQALRDCTGRVLKCLAGADVKTRINRGGLSTGMVEKNKRISIPPRRGIQKSGNSALS